MPLALTGLPMSATTFVSRLPQARSKKAWAPEDLAGLRFLDEPRFGRTFQETARQNMLNRIINAVNQQQFWPLSLWEQSGETMQVRGFLVTSVGIAIIPF